jgi:hypothetical protein
MSGECNMTRGQVVGNNETLGNYSCQDHALLPVQKKIILILTRKEMSALGNTEGFSDF